MLAQIAPIMTKRLRGTLGLTALTTVAFAAACSDDGDDMTGPGPGPAPDPPSADVSGTYALVEIRTLGNLGGGGPGLPVTFVDGSGNTLTFKSGTLTLGVDGTFALAVDATFNTSDVELTDEGTYAETGDGIDFSSSQESPRLFSAEFDGDLMTAQSQFGDIPFEIDLQKQ